jgi:N-acetylneuraminic acid mutarotase
LLEHWASNVGSDIGAESIKRRIGVESMKRPVILVLAVLTALVGAPPVAQVLGAPAWKMVAPLPKAIGEIVAATVQGKIYVLSGLDNAPGPATHTPTGLNWQYDPTTYAWTSRKSMPAPAHHVAVATWNDKIYVFGGFVRPPTLAAWQPTSNAWEYNPATDGWKALAPLPTPRGG